VRSRAWRKLLAATFPGANVRWRNAYGATLVKHGAGTFLPMHGDEAVRVGRMKERIAGGSPAAIAATASVDAMFDVLLTATLVGVSAWLGASVVDWHEIAAHPLKPALLLALVVAAIVTAVVARSAVRRKVSATSWNRDSSSSSTAVRTPAASSGGSWRTSLSSSPRSTCCSSHSGSAGRRSSASS
jgi:uncharacterized membrane protein YbhN (UPF0104 family)